MPGSGPAAVLAHVHALLHVVERHRLAPCVVDGAQAPRGRVPVGSRGRTSRAPGRSGRARQRRSLTSSFPLASGQIRGCSQRAMLTAPADIVNRPIRVDARRLDEIGGPLADWPDEDSLGGERGRWLSFPWTSWSATAGPTVRCTPIRPSSNSSSCGSSGGRGSTSATTARFPDPTTSSPGPSGGDRSSSRGEATAPFTRCSTAAPTAGRPCARSPTATASASCAPTTGGRSPTTGPASRFRTPRRTGPPTTNPSAI